MRAEEGDETIDGLADEARQAKTAVGEAVDEKTRRVGRPSSQPDIDSALEQNVDTPVDEALGGLPSPADE